MIEYMTPPIEANPDGVEIAFSREELWQALMWKGEFANLFVEPIVECNVLERFDDGFHRQIVVETPDGSRETVEERLFVEPQRKVTFLRLGGPVYGQIVNVIDEGDDPLTVRFGFTFGLPGAAHHGPEETAYMDKFAEGYIDAVNSTLARAREFIRTGTAPRLESAAT